MILNTTFLLLSLQNIHYSPLFSQYDSAQPKKLKLNSCYFSNFSQNILYSITSKPKIALSAAFFNRCLARPLFISSTERVYRETSDINLYLCKFQNIHVPNDSGGAIFSTYPVSVDTCSFYDISSNIGGVFSVCSSLQIKNTNIQKAAANIYGFAEISPNSPSIKIEETMANDVFTSASSGLRRHDGIETRVSNNNFTKFVTKSMVSVCEFGRTSVIFSFNYIFNCTSFDKNGALSFWQCDNFLCSDSLFLNILVSNSFASQHNGIVFWLDGSLQTGKIQHCAFCNCRTLNDQYGTLIYAEASTKIEITDCQFDKTREKSVNDRSDIFVIHDTKFSVGKIEFDGKLAGNVLYVPKDKYFTLVNAFPFEKFLYMLSFLSFIIFVIVFDKYS